jgi:hypothetical protein
MKITCVINNFLALNDSNTIERLKKYLNFPSGELNLKKDKEYDVYGILFRDNAPWYYICTSEEDECPTPYPNELFRVIDDIPSHYWRLVTYTYTDGTVASSMVFDEWAKDPLFYERLVDDDPSAIKVFLKYRKLIDQNK